MEVQGPPLTSKTCMLRTLWGTTTVSIRPQGTSTSSSHSSRWAECSKMLHRHRTTIEIKANSHTHRCFSTQGEPLIQTSSRIRGRSRRLTLITTVRDLHTSLLLISMELLLRWLLRASLNLNLTKVQKTSVSSPTLLAPHSPT